MYKIKRFSIQSGRPSKPGSLSRELVNRSGLGAGIGAAIGLLTGATTIAQNVAVDKIAGTSVSPASLKVGGLVILGSITVGAITGALSAMGANGRRSRATKVNMTQVLDELDVTVRNAEKGDKKLDINIFRYIDTDQDPKNYTMTMAYEDGCAILLLRNPKADMLAELNEDLELMVKYNRKADYVAEKAEDGYVVYVTAPNVYSITQLIYNVVYKCRIKINCLTEKKINL